MALLNINTILSVLQAAVLVLTRWKNKIALDYSFPDLPDRSLSTSYVSIGLLNLFTMLIDYNKCSTIINSVRRSIDNETIGCISFTIIKHLKQTKYIY